MHSRSASDPGDRQRVPSPRRPGPLALLAAVFLIEAVGLVGAVFVVFLGSLGGSAAPTSISSTAALLVLTLIAGIGLVLLAVGAWRVRVWVRTPGIVWQLVQLLVALYAFQGAGAQPVFGAAVAVPGVLGLVLLFVPSVSEALRRPDRRPDAAPPKR